jgi:glucose uptake protein GlcU
MEKIMQFLDKVPTWLQPIGFATALISAIIAGILFFGGKKSAESGKTMLAYVAVGIAIIAMAAAIVTTVRGAAE